MYLLYLDESGDPNGWQDQSHFVFGGLAVFEGHVFNLSNQLDAIQKLYFPGVSYPIAFHATDIRGGRGRFGQFEPETREKILTDVYTVIQNNPHPIAVAFATAMHISWVKNSMQVRREILEDMCMRFNSFLLREYKAQYPNKGLLIIDQNREQEYRDLINDFRQSGPKHGYLGNIMDIPYFAKCRETRMLQLADFVANAVFRYYERSDPTHLDTILPCFDKRQENQLDGLKHMTKEKCACVACSCR